MAVFIPIEGERWAKIDGFDYEVSDHGRVRSSKQRNGRLGTVTSWPSPLGYLITKLRRDSRCYYRINHRLVALAFLPLREGADEVNHKNGNKADNHVDNLEWVTRRENMRHARDVLGTLYTGEHAVHAKLTNQQAAEIRGLYAAGGLTHKAIGARFGVSKYVIYGVVRGLYYKAAV